MKTRVKPKPPQDNPPPPPPTEQPALWVRLNWVSPDRATMISDLLMIVRLINQGSVSGWDRVRGQWSAVMKFKKKSKP